MPKFRAFSWCAAAGLALSALTGCDYATEPDGPLLNDRFGPFNVVDDLTANRDSVDFTAGEGVVFSARFNKQTSWVLEIEGDSSGAIKRYEDFSNELTAENARWVGRTSVLPLFKDEPVTARLFFPNEAGSDTVTTSLDVVTPRQYPGIVIEDFEEIGGLEVTNPEFEFAEGFPSVSSEVPPGQGDGFLLLRGTDDVVANNFFIGLVTLRPEEGDFFEVPTNIADDLYFNCFLRGFGTANTIAVVEAVVGGRNIPLGGDVEFPNLGIVDFEGWQLYSEQASSFGAFGAGLTDEQTGQISALRIVLISDAANQPASPLEVEYGIDYITFTAGGPLEL